MTRILSTGIHYIVPTIFGAAILMTIKPGLAQGVVEDPKTVPYLNKITVSAAKRSLAFSDVTTGLSILTGDELRDAGITKIEELDKVIPGLKFNKQSNGAYTSITMRGIPSSDFYTPNVVVFIDGVPQDQNHIDLPLSDVEQVEILKGPQGSVYGKNAHLGAINVITKRPSEKIRTDISVDFSKIERETTTRISAPLIDDSLYAKLAVRGYTDQGQYALTTGSSDDVDDGRANGLEAKLIFEPSGGDFGAAFSFAYDHDISEDLFFTDANWRNRTASANNDKMERHDLRSSLNMSYDTDNWGFNSISSIQDRDMNRAVFNVKSDEEQAGFAQEIRASYDNTSSKFSGVVGANFDHIKFTRDANPFGAGGTYQTQVTMNNYALFGEITHQTTEKLNITTGGRFSYDKAKVDFVQAGGLDLEGKDSWSTFTPKVAANYDWTSTLSQYVVINQGYKAGGYNRTATNAAANQSYDPETSWNYETGMKASLFNDRLNLNAAFYYNYFDDIQLYTGILGQQLLDNQGDAKTTGLELEVRGKPTEKLEVIGGLTLNRTRLVTGDTKNGNWLPYAPRYVTNLGVQYTYENEQIPGAIIPRIDFRYSGKSYLDVGNSFEQKAFGILDLGVSYRYETLDVSVYANNVLDKVYKTYQGGTTTVQLGDGRNVGVRAAMSF